MKRYFHPKHAAVCRAALSVVLFVTWLNESKRLILPDGDWHHAFWTFLFASSLLLFALRKRHLIAGLAAYFLLWMNHHAVVAQAASFDPNRPSMPAALFFAYLVTGLALGTGPEEEAACWENGCAVIGACYTLAAMSKFNEAGFGWVNSHNVRMIVADLPPACSAAIASFRSFIVESPAMGLFASVFTFMTEIFGIAMLSGRLRPYYAVLILCMHSMISAGMSIHGYFSWAALLLVLSFPIQE